MKLIAAVSESWGIGYDNQLLYRIPEDMQFFRETTLGKIVVMGRNTFESIGKPLPNRKANVILTSDPTFRVPKEDYPILHMHNFNSMMWLLSEKEDVFCIGGAQLYAACLDYCDEAYITKIYDDKPANKFFPNLDEHPSWEVEWYKPVKESLNIKYQHMIYKNKNVLTYTPK